MSHRDGPSEIVEIDAIAVEEWEHEQHTPMADDTNLAALVKESVSANSAPIQRVERAEDDLAVAQAVAKPRTTMNTLRRPDAIEATKAVPTATRPANTPAMKPPVPPVRPIGSPATAPSPRPALAVGTKQAPVASAPATTSRAAPAATGTKPPLSTPKPVTVPRLPANAGAPTPVAAPAPAISARPTSELTAKPRRVATAPIVAIPAPTRLPVAAPSVPSVPAEAAVAPAPFEASLSSSDDWWPPVVPVAAAPAAPAQPATQTSTQRSTTSGVLARQPLLPDEPVAAPPGSPFARTGAETALDHATPNSASSALRFVPTPAEIVPTPAAIAPTPAAIVSNVAPPVAQAQVQWPSDAGLGYDDAASDLAVRLSSSTLDEPIEAAPLFTPKRRRAVVLVVAGVVVAILVIVMASGGSKPVKTAASDKGLAAKAASDKAASDKGLAAKAASDKAASDASDKAATATAATLTGAGTPRPAEAVAGAAMSPALAATQATQSPDSTQRVRTAHPTQSMPTTQSAANSRLKARKPVVVDYDKAPTSSPLDSDQSLAKARSIYANGNQRLFAGDTAGAIAQYRQALTAYPNYAASYRGIGLAYSQQANRPAALEAFKTYVKLAPTAKDVALVKQRIANLSVR